MNALGFKPNHRILKAISLLKSGYFIIHLQKKKKMKRKKKKRKKKKNYDKNRNEKNKNKNNNNNNNFISVSQEGIHVSERGCPTFNIHLLFPESWIHPV